MRAESPTGGDAGTPSQPGPFGPNGTVELADKVLLTGLLAVGLYSLALLPFAPSLLGTHTILSEALRGSTSSLITGGALAQNGDASIVTVLLAGLFGTVKFDWLYWWGGARWGEWWLDMMLQGKPRTARVVERLKGLMERWGTPIMLVSYLTPVPTVMILVLAGLSGMSLRRFLLLDLIAGLLWVGLLVSLGYAIGHPAISVAKQISHYGLLLGVGIAVIIIGRQVQRDRSRAPA